MINELTPAFKTTELGPLPEDWEVVRLGDVVTLVMGQSPPSSTYNSTGKACLSSREKPNSGIFRGVSHLLPVSLNEFGSLTCEPEQVKMVLGDGLVDGLRR